MSLLLDALNRAQRNKSSEKNSKEDSGKGTDDNLHSLSSVDLEGLELNDVEEEKNLENSVSSIDNNDEKNNKEEKNKPAETLSIQELDNESDAEITNNVAIIRAIEKPIMELESENGLESMDLEGLNLGEEKPDLKGELEEPKAASLDGLGLTELSIPEDSEPMTTSEPSEKKDIPSIADNENDLENDLLGINTEEISVSPATVPLEYEKPEALVEEIKEKTLDNNTPPISKINENVEPIASNNKIEDAGDRESSIKKLLETKKRKKLIISTVAALIVGFTISLSGYYYYVGQISDINNVVDQYADRTLTPIGAVPPEEMLQGDLSKNEATNSSEEEKLNSVNETLKPVDKIVISEKSAEIFRAKKITNKRVAPTIRKKQKKSVTPKKQRIVKKSVRKIQVKEPPVHLLLMSAFDEFQLGNDEVASSQYFSALALEKNNRDALLGLGAIAVRQKKLDTARNYYTQILKRNQSDSVARAALVGLVGQLDPIKAETELKLMLKNEPGAGYLHFALGNTYALQQRWLEAQKSFFNAFRIDGSNPDYAYNIAVSFDHLGEIPSAIKFYEHALEYSENKKVSFQRIQVKKRIASLKDVPSSENR